MSVQKNYFCFGYDVFQRVFVWLKVELRDERFNDWFDVYDFVVYFEVFVDEFCIFDVVVFVVGYYEVQNIFCFNCFCSKVSSCCIVNFVVYFNYKFIIVIFFEFF